VTNTYRWHGPKVSTACTVKCQFQYWILGCGPILFPISLRCGGMNCGALVAPLEVMGAWSNNNNKKKYWIQIYHAKLAWQTHWHCQLVTNIR